MSPSAPDGVWVTDEVGGTLVHVDRASRRDRRDDARRAAGGRGPRRRLALDRRAGRRRRPPRRHAEDACRRVDLDDSIDPARAYYAGAGSSSPWCTTGSSATSASAAPTETRSSPTSRARFPTPTDNGRTYTFRLREGIKFADGRELEASDVRSSLERLFRGSPARPDFYEGIVGGRACSEATRAMRPVEGRRHRRRHRDRHDQAARARPGLPLQAGAPVRVRRPDRHAR